MQTEFDISGTRLVATVSGAFDADQSVSKFASVLSFCRTYDLDQVLIDFRDLQGFSFATSGILYAHTISSLYQQHLAGGGNALRIAYLAPDTFIEGWNRGVGIARAAGLDVLATTELPEAMEWLEWREGCAS